MLKGERYVAAVDCSTPFEGFEEQKQVGSVADLSCPNVFGVTCIVGINQNGIASHEIIVDVSGVPIIVKGDTLNFDSEKLRREIKKVNPEAFLTNNDLAKIGVEAFYLWKSMNN